MQMPKKVKKIWDTVTTVLVVIVVIFAVFLMGSRLIGMQVFHVISPSMEPTYSVGDLLYVKTVDPDSVKVGDPITFVLNEDLVVATHRVVAVDGENRQFTTKGDANSTEDAAPVHFNNLIGVPVFSIPLLGYVSAYIQSPPGMYVAIAAGVILLAAVFLPDLFTKKDKKEEAQEEAQ
jgi:signal peptidase